MALKNQAITVCYVAWNTSTQAGQTGDSANHTLKLVQDGAEANPTNAPAQVDATNAPGTYSLALTAGDMNFNCVCLCGKSSTANVVIIPLVIVTESGVLPHTACTTNASLLTSGTGTDQLSVTSGKVLLQATQAGVTIPAVTAVTGAVGSVTGAVGSVTGAVGSVTGAVGSVTAAVSANVTQWSGTAVGAYYGPFKTGVASGFAVALVSSVDHVTPYTAGGVTAVRSVSGGSEASVGGTVSQVGSSNRYYFAGTASDFTGSSIEYTFSATGADSVTISVNTTP